MRRAWLLMGLFCFAPLWGAFDSALAPYPALKNQLDPLVERELQRLSANAVGQEAFSAVVNWSVDPGVVLNSDRNNCGPLAAKSSLNWHSPGGGRFWNQGTVTVSCMGRDFRIEKAEEDGAPADWWHKEGEHTFSR